MVFGVMSVASVLVLSGCGSGSGSCGKVQPCGGDVVGNWTIAGSCANGASMSAGSTSCPTATGTASTNASGTLSFAQDGSYMANVTLSGVATINYPQSCLTMSGVTITCTQLDQALQLQIAMTPGVFQSAHCSGSGSCTCTLVLAPQTTNEMGTYTTAGTTLAASGMLGGGPYCVQGNELHLISIDTTMPVGPMGQMVISSDIVATKH